MSIADTNRIAELERLVAELRARVERLEATGKKKPAEKDNAKTD